MDEPVNIPVPPLGVNLSDDAQDATVGRLVVPVSPRRKPWKRIQTKVRVKLSGSSAKK